MPDIDQDSNTCFPTSTANLLYWFGENGYPALLSKDTDATARQRNLIAKLLVHTNGTFKNGTEFAAMTKGLSSFFKAHNIDAKVTYRGLGGDAFSGLDWFERNSEDNVGFILCLAYVHKKGANSYLSAAPLGHCVTLLRYHDGVAAILDPAHAEGETGRRTLRLIPVSQIKTSGATIPMLFEVSGMPLEGSHADTVLLDGAVCIELPPVANTDAPVVAGQKPAITP